MVAVDSHKNNHESKHEGEEEKISEIENSSRKTAVETFC